MRKPKKRKVLRERLPVGNAKTTTRSDGIARFLPECCSASLADRGCHLMFLLCNENTLNQLDIDKEQPYRSLLCSL